MEQLINRLIKIGYKQDEAENLFRFYERMGDLEGLENFIISNEPDEPPDRRYYYSY